MRVSTCMYKHFLLLLQINFLNVFQLINEHICDTIFISNVVHKVNQLFQINVKAPLIFSVFVKHNDESISTNSFRIERIRFPIKLFFLCTRNLVDSNLNII